MTTSNRRYVLARRPLTLPDASHFAIETLPVPTPQQGQVLVRTLLVALSPWQGQRLKDFRNYTQPFAIGELIDCDVLGQVIASQCAALPVGCRVTGRLGWQEYAVASEAQLLRASDEFDETLWLTALSSPGLTAYTALQLFGRPMPGNTMLVTSAAGSVGSYAVQLGKLAGMRVVGIAGTRAKCERIVSQLGADASVAYRDADFTEQLAHACDGGIDLVFDTVGGPIGDAVFDHINQFATVLIVGRTASNNSDRPDLDFVNMRQLWAREANIQCFSRYSYPREWARARKKMQELLRRGQLQAIDNVIDGFAQTPRALHDMLAGHHIGKVLVRYARPEAFA